MCSTQMERMFNTTRIPGIETGMQPFRFGRVYSYRLIWGRYLLLSAVLGGNILVIFTTPLSVVSFMIEQCCFIILHLPYRHSGLCNRESLGAVMGCVLVPQWSYSLSFAQLFFPFTPCNFRYCAAPDWPEALGRLPQGPVLPSVAVHWRTPPLTQWTWGTVSKDPQWHVRTGAGRTETSSPDCRKQVYTVYSHILASRCSHIRNRYKHRHPLLGFHGHRLGLNTLAREWTKRPWMPSSLLPSSWRSTTSHRVTILTRPIRWTATLNPCFMENATTGRRRKLRVASATGSTFDLLNATKYTLFFLFLTGGLISPSPWFLIQMEKWV